MSIFPPNNQPNPPLNQCQGCGRSTVSYYITVCPVCGYNHRPQVITNEHGQPAKYPPDFKTIAEQQ